MSAKESKLDRNWFKRLFNTKNFRQQKLPAWTPVLTVTSVVPTFILAAISLIVIGGGFIFMATTNRIFELEYTNCIPLRGSRTCSQILSHWQEHSNSSWPPPDCSCWYKFRLEHDLHENVFVYYALYNYFQNHLRYGRSKDMSQFRGERSASRDCQPYQYGLARTANNRWQYRPIVPCGVIANSMFNDTFTFWLVERNQSVHSITQVPLSRRNLAWSWDQMIYRSPNARNVFRNFTNPPYWGNRTIWDLDPDDPANNGLQNEALIVWMRVAAFPDFWKLYARIVHRNRKWKQFYTSLPRGQYYLRINYNYPVSNFKGRKSFVLANTNKAFGASYLFLGILYVVIGGLCAILAVFAFIIHKQFGLSKEEIMFTDEKTPYFFEGREEILLRRRKRALDNSSTVSSGSTRC